MATFFLQVLFLDTHCAPKTEQTLGGRAGEMKEKYSILERGISSDGLTAITGSCLASL